MGGDIYFYISGGSFRDLNSAKKYCLYSWMLTDDEIERLERSEEDPDWSIKWPLVFDLGMTLSPEFVQVVDSQKKLLSEVAIADREMWPTDVPFNTFLMVSTPAIHVSEEEFIVAMKRLKRLAYIGKFKANF